MRSLGSAAIRSGRHCLSRPADWQASIDLEVVARHALDREALLERGAYAGAIEVADTTYRFDRRIDGIDDESILALADDFGHRARAPGHAGRATRHRFDHDQPERFRPIDRKQQRPRLAQELALVALADFSYVFHVGLRQQRLDLGGEILAVRGIHLGRDAQLQARAAGDLDGAVGAFLRREAPEKREVTLLRRGLEWAKISR